MHLGSRSLTLVVDGIPRTGDVSDCRIASVPFDSDRFSVRALGGPDRQYRLRGTAAQDPSEGSLWDLIWSGLHRKVEVDIRPAGGLAVSAAFPAFIGIVTITEPEGDILGGAANPALANRLTFAFDWPFTEKPTRVVA